MFNDFSLIKLSMKLFISLGDRTLETCTDKQEYHIIVEDIHGKAKRPEIL